MASDHLGEIPVELRRLPSDAKVSLRVTVTHEWRIRLWLGLALMKLGARVLGCGVDVRTEREEGEA